MPLIKTDFLNSYKIFFQVPEKIYFSQPVELIDFRNTVLLLFLKNFVTIKKW